LQLVLDPHPPRMAPAHTCGNRDPRRRAPDGNLVHAACNRATLLGDDPARHCQLCPRQAASRQRALARIGFWKRPRPLTRTGTATCRAAGLPLRAAAIFAPLSSRTAAPTTTRSHKVARKARVPKGAIIASILVGAPNRAGPDLFRSGQRSLG